MVDTTKVKSLVADIQDLGTAFSTEANPLKAYIDSLSGGVGTNQVVALTSGVGGQTTFPASPADPTLCFVFIEGVFQTQGIHYNISGNDIVFTSTVPEGTKVTFVERKLSTSTIVKPGGDAGQFLGKTSGADGAYDWLTLPGGGGGGGGSNNPGTTLALAHATVSGGVLTENFDLFGNIIITRVSAGSYTVAFIALTFPTANSYVATVTADYGTSNSLRSIRITSRTTTGFSFVVEDPANTDVDPEGLNIIVSGDPSLATTNMIVEPVGAITFFPMPYPPVGYLECNGASVLKSTYPALYQVLSSATGVNPWGETPTNFTLPDLRGEFIRGWSHGRAAVDVGRVFGSSQSDDNKAHTHTTVADAAFPTNSNIYDVTRKYTAKDGPISSTAYYSLGGVATVPTLGETSSSGTESHPRNVALLPCIKALPDYNNYVASQAVESFVVTSFSQTTFTTTQVDTRYSYVFVDGAYQPPSEYTTPTSNQIVFAVPLQRESVVDVVKVYTASTPPASKGQMEAQSGASVMVTPEVVRHSPLVAKAWTKFSGATGAQVASSGIASVVKGTTGRYTITWATPFTSGHYIVMATIQNISEGTGSISVTSQSSNSVSLMARQNITNDPVNPDFIHIVAFGLQ